MFPAFLSLIFILSSFNQPDSKADPGNNINKLSKKEIREGWKLLFDGVSSKGWIKADGSPFPEEGWFIRDGLLSLSDGQKGGDIKTIEEFSDFELSVDFLYSPSCNSGIKYFFTKYEKGGFLGMEYQLLDDELAEDNNRKDHLCGALYDIFPPDSSRKNLRGPGEWNNALIVSKGMHIEHWLNGKKIVEFERGSQKYLDGVAKSKYKTEPVFGMIEKGNIMLQDHGHSISFRNIKIRRL
jgi:hypothetical protein